MSDSKNPTWTRLLTTVLRIAIGWHLLYEGASKILAGDWSAAAYLKNASGPLAGFYHWLGSSEAMLKVIDPLNMYGLVAIGLALFLGVVIRPAAICGAVLLGSYYFAYPPFGASAAMQEHGSSFIVNAALIEAIALVAIACLTDRGFGIGALIPRKRKERQAGPDLATGGRREALQNLATLPLLGVVGWTAHQNREKYGADVMSGATITTGEVDISDLKGELPKGKIGDHEISRLVMGGNLIGGWAHSRDLLYVSSLFKAYNTEQRVFDTLRLAEAAGINTINIGFPSNPLMQKYKRVTGSKIKVITQIAPDVQNNDYYSRINQAIDFGVDIIQLQGNQCDWLVRDGKVEIVGLILEKIRSQGYTAGLGAHSVDALIACEEQGIIPDYYMKTLHHDRYWSAHPPEQRQAFEVDGKRHLDHNRFHDNIFCLDPDRSVEFVTRAKVPVMGFKVLAAGAIRPQDGFRWAFENGADFICVGMFDFQIVKDVNITLQVLNRLKNRQRNWFG
jgi:uncharacterized membrane protein YphA (DoxX/SURF4 family)